jgi:hypothetical protein
MAAEIPVLNHGFVALVDTMGDDRTPAKTARTSYRNKTERTSDEDAKLSPCAVTHAVAKRCNFELKCANPAAADARVAVAVADLRSWDLTSLLTAQVAL